MGSHDVPYWLIGFASRCAETPDRMARAVHVPAGASPYSETEHLCDSPMYSYTLWRRNGSTTGCNLASFEDLKVVVGNDNLATDRLKDSVEKLRKNDVVDVNFEDLPTTEALRMAVRYRGMLYDLLVP